MGDFRKLRAWQEARALALLTNAVSDRLPKHERYALGDQWRRAAYSVVLNLSEGMGRRGPREFRRYVDIARGSLHEVETVLELVKALKYLPEEELRPLQDRRIHCARLVHALLRKLDGLCR